MAPSVSAGQSVHGFDGLNGCEAARAKGRCYASEKAGLDDTHVQSGTDLVGCEAARASGRGYASEKAFLDATHVQSGADLVGRRFVN